SPRHIHLQHDITEREARIRLLRVRATLRRRHTEAAVQRQVPLRGALQPPPRRDHQRRLVPPRGRRGVPHRSPASRRPVLSWCTSAIEEETMDTTSLQECAESLFAADDLTSVLLVSAFEAGDPLVLSERVTDLTPVAPSDLFLVKLIVGPGN